MIVSVPVMIAPKIKEDSWLNDPKYAWFKEGYLAASQQTRAIPSLAATTPEELYFAVTAILDEAKDEGLINFNILKP